MTRVVAGEVAVRAPAVNLMLAAVGDELIVAHDGWYCGAGQPSLNDALVTLDTVRSF